MRQYGPRHIQSAQYAFVHVEVFPEQAALQAPENAQATSTIFHAPNNTNNANNSGKISVAIFHAMS